jgi:hypothetical protein
LRLDVSPQLQELVLTRLIRRADPRVDTGDHRASSALSRPARRIASAALNMRWHERSGTSPTLQPVLKVAARILGAFESQGCGAEERHALGLDFAKVAGRPWPVLLNALRRVPQNHMRDLMEQRAIWHRRERRHGDLLPARESPHVAVCVVERDPLDAKRLQRSRAIPVRDRIGNVVLAFVWESTNQLRFSKNRVNAISSDLPGSCSMVRLTVIGIHSAIAFCPFCTNRPRSFHLLKDAIGPGAIPRSAHWINARIWFPRL